MSGKSLQLRFKGDKKKKKKSHSSGSGSSKKRKTDDQDTISDVEEYGGDEQAWVPAISVNDVSGPTFLFQRMPDETAHPFCLSFNTTLNAVEAAAVVSPKDVGLSSLSGLQDLQDAEIVSVTTEITPQSVHQVWVATRIPSTNKWTFRSAEGKFLGCDKHGVVHAISEARGPQEEWDVIDHPDVALSSSLGMQTKSLALRSVYGGYLTIDTVAGGKRVIRADANEIGTLEKWQLCQQWKFRHETRYPDHVEAERKRKKGEDPITAASLDQGDPIESEIKLFKSRTGIQFLPTQMTNMSQQDKKALKRAQKQGRLAEEMLDRREKFKSDKYAN